VSGGAGARGHFVTFEGGEGAGKSTQIHRLAERLRAAGQEILATREPGGTAEAEAVRGLLLTPERAWQPLSEALLHAAARSEHLAGMVRPALAAGRWVLCDRFMDSTRAYQGAGQGLDPDAIDALDRLVVADARPDLTLILDVDPAVGLQRAAGRSDRYQALDPAFHARVRDAFRRIAEAEPERCVLIDALRPVDDVAAEVRTAVAERFGVAV
jgi:dTMP kinase